METERNGTGINRSTALWAALLRNGAIFPSGPPPSFTDSRRCNGMNFPS